MYVPMAPFDEDHHSLKVAARGGGGVAVASHGGPAAAAAAAADGNATRPSCDESIDDSLDRLAIGGEAGETFVLFAAKNGTAMSTGRYTGTDTVDADAKADGAQYPQRRNSHSHPHTHFIDDGGGGRNGASSTKQQRKFAGLRDSLASARRRSKGFHVQSELEEDGGIATSGNSTTSPSSSSFSNNNNNNNGKSGQRRKKSRNPFRRPDAAAAAAGAGAASGGDRKNHPGPGNGNGDGDGDGADGDQYEPPPSLDLSSPPLSSSPMPNTPPPCTTTSSTPSTSHRRQTGRSSSRSRSRSKTIADENAEDRPRARSRSRSTSRSRSILRSVSRHMPTGIKGNRTTSSSGGRNRRRSKGERNSTYAGVGTNEDGLLGTVDDEDEDEDHDVEEEEEEDPLIDLFETHNRRRVMFDPTFAPPQGNGSGNGNGNGSASRGGKAGAEYQLGKADAGGSLTRASSSSFNIKGFMNRIIHKGGKESAVEVVDDDEIASFMAPAPAGGPTGTDIVPESPPHAPSTLAARPSSALRSGRRGSGKFFSAPPTTSPPSAAATSFDPYLIDKAKSRSSTTAAVANAAFSRSTRFDESTNSSSDMAAVSPSSSPSSLGAASGARSIASPSAGGKFSYKNFRQRGGGGTATDNAVVDAGGGPRAVINSSKPFQEDPQVTKRIERLIGRANRAHTRTYRYEHAIGYYLAALEMLTKEEYPESHELVSKAVRKLNDCHHAQSSLKNSANIVKMGIKHENRGEFVRALKMYTIAYRIRRDALSKFHPSLPVLLNMLGSVQVKRGELKEAMQIYELALNGRPDDMKSVSERRKAEMIHPTTKSVTLRDMGMIYERWGDDDKALQLYEESLAFVMKNRQQEMTKMQEKGDIASNNVEDGSDSNKFGRSFLARSRSALATAAAESSDMERVSCGSEGELEVYLETSSDMLRAGSSPGFGFAGRSFDYDDFFPPMGGDKKSKNLRGKKDKKAKAGKGGREGSDVNVAITLHQVAQINRRRGQHTVALSAYQVALRGMKQALGDRHPNVAAILGNLGNLYKDMGKFDEAYGIYQEVLSIETHHLGLSHPEVSITLHNIATIESSRGRYSDAINLYTQVIKMQKSLFGPNHISAAVTSSCMGDVYERMGNTKKAIDMYEETLRIRSEIMGRQHVDVGRLLHKLGCLSLQRGDYRKAEVYVTKAAAIYLLNDLKEDHPWMRDIRRNEADIKGLLATGLATGLNQDDDSYGEL